MKSKILSSCPENFKKSGKSEKSVAFFGSNSWHGNGGFLSKLSRYFGDFDYDRNLYKLAHSFSLEMFPSDPLGSLDDSYLNFERCFYG